MYSHETEALLRTLNAPRRNHFFYGKRMDVQHFEMEQSYGKLKQWLLNRLTLGKGVLCGLRVSVDGSKVCVDPGVAIDGLGREIVVPVRACIDPLAADDGCCGSREQGQWPQRPVAADAGHHAAAGEAGDPESSRDGIYTLWVCYHQCLAGHEPALVSDCDTRSACAASTVVESFCLKVTPGLAPLQGDPEWCARLWPKPATPPPDEGSTPHSGAASAPVPGSGSLPGVPGLTAADTEAISATLDSRRHVLCEIFSANCDPGDADPCVPLAAIAVRGGRIFVQECLVRPRIYSNARLLDLILCLADKIEHCCNHEQPQPVDFMRLRSVDFLARNPDGRETQIVTMATPLADTQVSINANPNAIRLRFSRPFAQDQHIPSTHGPGDADFTRHNVQILPDDVLGGIAFVPGSLVLEAPDTVRFDLDRQSPYFRSNGGWQKGRYRILLRGTANITAGQQALADGAGNPLDGDPIAPAGGFLSGDGAAAGDFSAYFVVGGQGPIPEPTPDPAPTLRVRSVEFLQAAAPGTGAEQAIAKVEPPTTPTVVEGHPAAIRVRFDRPFSQLPQFVPSTHSSLSDSGFANHNFQVLIAREDSEAVGVRYVPGTLVLEAPDTIRFNVARGSRVVNADGRWRRRMRCQLLLPGKRATAAAREPISDLATSQPLDGEIKPPADGVISGDKVPGGDFLADFMVVV